MSELEKIVAVREQSQAIGEFLDLQTKYVLAEWVKCTKELHSGGVLGDYGEWRYEECQFDEHLLAVKKSIHQILADYFEIDLDKAEEEQRQILNELRNGGVR